MLFAVNFEWFPSHAARVTCNMGQNLEILTNPVTVSVFKSGHVFGLFPRLTE